MSRPLTVVCCAIALAAGAGAALAAAAPAQRSSHMIICPLEPTDTITQPCCGPPIVTVATSSAFVCCGTPQPINCPLGLTLSSSANPSIAGQKITLTGRWPGNAAGKTVELFQEMPGAKAFSRVAQTKTGSLGDFQFVRKGVETNRKWYVAVGSEKSMTITQRVKAVVTLAPRGHFHGHVTPNHAGERVWLELQGGKQWQVIGRARLSDRSNYAFASVRCDSSQRIVFPGDQRNAWSASRVFGVGCPY